MKERFNNLVRFVRRHMLNREYEDAYWLLKGFKCTGRVRENAVTALMVQCESMYYAMTGKTLA